MESDAVFIANVKNEYRYYYILYIYAITKLLNAMLATDTAPVAGWVNNTAAVNSYKLAAISLNTTVNDITYAIDKIAQFRRATKIPQLTEQLNALDTSLQSQANTLYRQREVLSKDNQSNMVLQKEMEAYSRQKSSYHNNMLMLYSFLNITALGLLFYVYRSM